jgi:hypothetical protein
MVMKKRGIETEWVMGVDVSRLQTWSSERFIMFAHETFGFCAHAAEQS